MEHKRSMFNDMLPCYADLSVWSLMLFTGNRRPIRSLIDSGRRKTGSLKGIDENNLEDIVGTDMMDGFRESERMLSRTPQDWICDVWAKDIHSRRGDLILKRSKGRSYSDIAQEEGLSRQRITQMVTGFFLRQEVFLLLIEENLKRAADYDRELEKIFPDKTFRSIYLTWKSVSDRRRPSKSAVMAASGSNAND